jgi:hypothetical protein
MWLDMRCTQSVVIASHVPPIVCSLALAELNQGSVVAIAQFGDEHGDTVMLSMARATYLFDVEPTSPTMYNCKWVGECWAQRPSDCPLPFGPLAPWTHLFESGNHQYTDAVPSLIR